MVSALIGSVILSYAPTPVFTGKSLEGWAYDELGTEPVGATDVVSEADTLYAVWEDE